MLVRGPSLERSMSRYLIEQIAALPNIVVRTGSSAVAAEGDDGHLQRACACATAGGASPSSTSTPASSSSAPRRAPTGSTASSRATSAASSSRARTRGRRLAAQARALPARDDRARRLRGRRRARALVQARRQRGRRGLDGRLADPPVPRRRMSAAAALTLRELRTIDLFDDLDDDQLGEWLAGRAASTAAPGEIARRARRAAARRVPAARGHDARRCSIDGEHVEPVGPPARADLDRRDRGADRGPARRARCRPRRPAASRVIEPAEFRRLALAQPAVHRRVMQQVAPVMSRITAIEQNRERLPRSARWPPGSRTSSTTRPRRPAARPARWPRPSTSSARRCAASSSPAIEREEAAKLVALQREAIERAAGRTALDALDAADAEDALLERLEALGVPEPWRLAEPLAAAGVDEAWLERVAALGRPGDRTPRCAGWRRRSRRAAWRPSCRSRRGACRVSSAPSSPTPTWTAATLVEVDLHEGLETTLDGARPPAQAHLDRGRARLRPRRCRS